jgi:hypothetical protein
LRFWGLWFLLGVAFGRNDRSTVDFYRDEAVRFARTARMFAQDAFLRGELEEALKLLAVVESDSDEAPFLITLATRARIMLAAGRLAEGHEAFQQWRESPRWNLSPVFPLVGAYCGLGTDLLRLAKTEALKQAYHLLCRTPARRLAQELTEAPDVMRGALSLRLGDVDAAERHYTDGLEWAARPEVRYTIVEGRCLQGLADVAEARGQHEFAAQHLDAAAAKFHEYGAKLYLDQVLAKKDFLKA